MNSTVDIRKLFFFKIKYVFAKDFVQIINKYILLSAHNMQIKLCNNLQDKMCLKIITFCFFQNHKLKINTICKSIVTHAVITTDVVATSVSSKVNIFSTFALVAQKANISSRVKLNPQPSILPILHP